MEALLFIFAEILFACLAPLLAALGALVAALFEVVAGLLGLAFGGSAVKKRPPKKAGTATSSAAQKARRKVLHWIAGTVGGLGALGVLASVVFFEPILGSILQRAGDKAGISVAYEKAEGSFLTGRVQLSGLTMARSSDAGLAFDIAAREVEADVVLSSLIFGEPRLQLARVEGVSGFVTPPEPKEGPREKKARRAFRADLVQASDVSVEVRPREGEAYDLAIDSAEVAPFRSRLALFDLLFRSTLEAQVADQPLFVSTRVISENGRETIWSFERGRGGAVEN